MDQIFEEMGNIRIQFQDMKRQMEDVKGQLEDTKIQLENTKIQLENTKTELNEAKIKLEDTKIQLEYSKTKTSKLDKKSADIYEYTKDPCKNCNGSTFCLDGQVVPNTLEKGTKIRAPKNCTGFLHANDTGVVATVDPSCGPLVEWNKSRFFFSFSGCVYNCK